MTPPRSRDDWIQAAIAGLSAHGEAGLSVEGLARRLRVTKGSFYWHFQNRAALLGALLEAFEARGADEPIAELSLLADGRDRLRLLFALAFRHPEELRAEQALFAMKEPGVRRVLQRVHKKRRAFLTLTYRSLGLAQEDAEAWAATAYAAFVGAVGLATQAPWNDDEQLLVWVEHLVQVLIPPQCPRT